MKIRKCEGRLKNGEIVLFRSANKSDAFELLKLFFQWSNESQYLLRAPEEYNDITGGERTFDI